MVVDPDVAAVDDPGEQRLVLEAALLGDQLDVVRAAVEVEPDALDGQVAEDAVGVADVVEVGLDDDPGALVDLRELLVGEASASSSRSVRSSTKQGSSSWTQVAPCWPRRSRTSP